jgi:hypothetical protein
LRFAEELFPRLRATLRIREDFDRDIALQLLIASPIDLAHAAGAELFYDSVVRDDLANQRRGIRHVALILG